MFLCLFGDFNFWEMITCCPYPCYLLFSCDGWFYETRPLKLPTSWGTVIGPEFHSKSELGMIIYKSNYLLRCVYQFFYAWGIQQWHFKHGSNGPYRFYRVGKDPSSCYFVETCHMMFYVLYNAVAETNILVISQVCSRGFRWLAWASEGHSCQGTWNVDPCAAHRSRTSCPREGCYGTNKPHTFCLHRRFASYTVYLSC